VGGSQTPGDSDEQGVWEESDQAAGSGGPGCLRWLAAGFLAVLLIALLWPVKEEQKVAPPSYDPPKFFVTRPNIELISRDQIDRLGLRTDYPFDYFFIDFQLESQESRNMLLTSDNFQLIVKRGGRTMTVNADPASEHLTGPEESPWGKPLSKGETIGLRLLFRTFRDVRIEAFRVHDADRRSSRYKDFTLKPAVAEFEGQEQLEEQEEQEELEELEKPEVLEPPAH
jgi:hypothetical protein